MHVCMYVCMYNFDLNVFFPPELASGFSLKSE